MTGDMPGIRIINLYSIVYRFLSALESRWKESVLLTDVCDIITEHTTKYFECYVHYCSNQAFQDRAVTDLR
jgi:hypothetical protein